MMPGTEKSQSSNISMFLRDTEVNHKKKSAEALTVVVSEPWETALCRFGERIGNRDVMTISYIKPCRTF